LFKKDKGGKCGFVIEWESKNEKGTVIRGMTCKLNQVLNPSHKRYLMRKENFL